MKLKLNYAVVLLATVCNIVTAQVDRDRAGPVSAEGFFDRYTLQSANMDNLRFVRDPAGSGRTVLHATVFRTDEKIFNGLRTEIIPRSEYVKSGIRWYAFSFYVPPDWREDPNLIIIAQLHTSQKDVPLSPPVAIAITGHRIELHLQSNHRKISGEDPATKANSARQTILIGRLERAKWYCFVARADWFSTVGAGAFKLWLNSEPIYEAENLYNGYETWLGNYPKSGVYAPGGLASPSKSIYMDFIHTGGAKTRHSDLAALTPCGSNGEEKAKQ